MIKKIDFTQFARIAKSDSQGEAKIEASKIYILPTKYGIIYAAILMIMLVGSINYANNLGFILTFILSGMGLATMVHTWRNLLSLRINSIACQPAYKGQEATFKLLFKSPQRPRSGIQIKTADDQQVFDLAKDETKEIQIQQKSTQRGWMSLKRITVYSLYPLGLLRSWGYIDLTSHCLIYPNPAKISAGQINADSSTSNYGNKGVGNDDFAGHRHYQLGDPPKQIDWKAAARQQTLVLKLFAGENSEQVWLDWHAIPSDNSIESRLSLLTKAVLESHRAGILYGLKLPEQTIELNQGQHHQHQCLAALALYGKS